MRKFTSLAAAIALLSGCALGPDYQAQTPDLPDQWPEHELLGQDTGDWQQWWTRFDDATLNALVERALNDNLNLQVQIQRIEQARAELGLSNANRWPSLSAQANATRERTPETVSQTGTEYISERYAVNGVLSYELDLWGRLAREREAASALLAQSVFGTEAIRLNLITDVVTTYFNLRAAEQQLAITRETLGTREETLVLEEVRYESGASNPLSIR
ncbi:TolC family protein [Marinimicrobium koreense]|uniref:TolC family protein n=1 Tax=Marinimicrobium koreense TaxID=306545 RepID=UPI003F71768E